MEKRLTNILCIWCSILIFTCEGLCQEEAVESDIESLRLESAKLIPMYKNLEGWSDTTQTEEAALTADREVTGVVQRLFENLKSFELIKERTKGVALFNVGINIAINIAMIAITTRSSISVKPLDLPIMATLVFSLTAHLRDVLSQRILPL